MDRGWTHPETGWEIYSGTNMCLFLVEEIFIDNELAEINHHDAVGIFYNDECIGWAYYDDYITIIPTIGDDGSNPQFPTDYEQLKFYIYDKSHDQILSLQSLLEMPNWTSWGSHTIPISYGCTLNLPIQTDGTCPNTCDGDLNNDMIIDIIDIISIIGIILSCNECDDISCGDIDGNNQINVQDILVIVDLIVGN